MSKRTAVVTGAAGALGSELTLQLVQRGWNVIMLDSDRRTLEKVHDRIAADASGEGVMYPMDLLGANPENVGELLDAVVAEFGGLDALVHCAARFENLTPVEHIPPQEWLLHMQVNLNSPWLLSAMALPLLRGSAAGKLVFLLEDLAKVEGALWGAYGVSKHAVRTLVNQLAQECRGSSVAVRGVDPGPMRSGIRTRAYHAENPAHMPSPLAPAIRIAEFLDGHSDWEEVFVSLPAPGRD
jgi:NAD(P)-dependent dehydrogenase (short-subunit alcohol dehydrogenase family)